MKKVKDILKYVATGFLVLLVLLCVYTFIVTDLLKKDYVNVFGYTYFVVATGSMSGTIEVDDVIFVKITKDVKTNEIITYKNKDGDIITHRLVNKNGNTYITKGDVNNAVDDAVTRDQIIGKVKFIISPSFILKTIAIFLIVFILLALVNFDNIIKKFVVKEAKAPVKIPDAIFESPKPVVEDTSTGLTVTIAIEEMEKLKRSHEKELENEVEVLDFDEYMVEEPDKKQKREAVEKETIDLVVSILKCKNKNVAKARMNKKWLAKYQYVYRLCHLLLLNNVEQLLDDISSPKFTEIYDYDLNRVGLTEIIRNRVFDMPIYVFLRLLTYSILYNDDEMFDGIYKILRYKVMFDKDNLFRQIQKSDKNAIKQVKTLISFMQKVSNKFDNKNVFELDKIERMAKIENY
ncbi:MAG: S26 family signal peptidase [Bacilli bacterium]|nr:S26 family signal peptidase [Bacilli bacterium]